jgi:hypothetical protein
MLPLIPLTPLSKIDIAWNLLVEECYEELRDIIMAQRVK